MFYVYYKKKNIATIRVHRIQYNGTSDDQNVSIYLFFFNC